MKPPNQGTVSKGNIHVDGIQVKVFCAVKSTALLGFRNCGIRAEGGGKLAAINSFAIPTDLKEVLVISKLPTTHDAMQLLCSPMGLCVGCICSIARPN
jgi:hypothetical protein